ncbi:hypothetical protein BD289DRAFT_62872 [Coniella lustricola]|uniref:Uncharacterized protein n=1 Tax=Coniella lustricola TaxID=2025994 RepID=A0A2T3A0D7_9PEZI|nr:hypothetical protein BD289DRAFT_62872 [Coniella lustricola]
MAIGVADLPKARDQRIDTVEGRSARLPSQNIAIRCFAVPYDRAQAWPDPGFSHCKSNCWTPLAMTIPASSTGVLLMTANCWVSCMFGKLIALTRLGSGAYLILCSQPGGRDLALTPQLKSQYYASVPCSPVESSVTTLLVLDSSLFHQRISDSLLILHLTSTSLSIRSWTVQNPPILSRNLNHTYILRLRGWSSCGAMFLRPVCQYQTYHQHTVRPNNVLM